MSNPKLTQKRLKELLHYDPETGIFIWNFGNKRRVKKGDVAGSVEKEEYRRIEIKNIRYQASNLAFLYMEGYYPENEIDHKNRIRHDDRWSNLREATHQCNCKNRGIMSNNKSGITGIHFNKGNNKLLVQIAVNCKIKHIGYFINLKDAAKARWEAEKKYNYPNCNNKSSSYNYLKERNLV